MIQFKETGRIIEHVWSNLHECQLLDKRLEEVKNHLKNKYYIDYLGVNCVNNGKTHYIANMSHDLWHTFVWDSYLSSLCLVFSKNIELYKGENRLIFFSAAQEVKNFEERIICQNDLRAYYVQEQKEGYSVAFSTENGVVQFCFTFTSNKHLGEMVKDSYLSLVTYFNEIAPILMVPFLEYFSRYNTLEDSIELENLIKEYPLRY